TPLRPISVNRNHFRIVLNEIERLSGRRPMIYTNFASWRTIMGDDPIINEYEIWVASWRLDAPYLPVPLKEWKLHQFTASYKVLNYYRGLDANYFNGNEADFEAWLQSMKPEPPPPPDHGFEGFFLNYKGRDYEGVVREVVKS
ncbi:hypothetical protein LCGC14_3150910, partial [marine sediment metagenome]